MEELGRSDWDSCCRPPRVARAVRLEVAVAGISLMSGSDGYDEAAFRFLVDLRGGFPEKCDFCGERYSDTRYPVPEEAGAWSCNICEKIA